MDDDELVDMRPRLPWRGFLVGAVIAFVFVAMPMVTNVLALAPLVALFHHDLPRVAPILIAGEHLVAYSLLWLALRRVSLSWWTPLDRKWLLGVTLVAAFLAVFVVSPLLWWVVAAQPG